MDALDKWQHAPDTEDDMARAKARPLDEARIAAVVQELRLTIDKPPAFKPVFEALAGDVTLSAGDIIEIAHRLLGGARAKSRKAALTAIAQERMRLSHARSKGQSAKVRVW